MYAPRQRKIACALVVLCIDIYNAQYYTVAAEIRNYDIYLYDISQIVCFVCQ